MGEPFTFYEIQKSPIVYNDLDELDFRHQWRNFFNDRLGLKLSEPLDEIKTPEERKADRDAFWVQRSTYQRNVLKAGMGPKIKQGDKVQLYWTGSYPNGDKFVIQRRESIIAGDEEMIRCFSEGLIGLQ